MECRNCGNTQRFQALITDYRPMEIWEFENGNFCRFNQPDSDDLDIKVRCLKCDSDDIDTQGLVLEEYASRPLETLSDEAWDSKVSV
jgi:hypothetical protein